MSCCDVNRVDELAFGPFSDLTDFHEYLFTRIPPQKASKIREEALLVHAKSHHVFFAHGDLNLRNILVEKGKITGIVDWTCAGWYPGYWELGKATYVHRRFQKWLDMWSRILPGYEAELDVEMKMWD
jgi:aminoglycoside phosphotransferase (APT) family kinase protein